jgi:ABC-type transport system substrate-binding protein
MIKILCILVVSSCLFFSCTENQLSNKSQYGGIINLEYSDPASTLDPIKILFGSDWLVSSLVYEGLVGYTENYNELEPLIAQSWKVTDNGRTYIFHLRKNCYFNSDACFGKVSTRKVSAYDVKYSFERIADPSSGCLNKSLFENKIVGWRDFVENRENEISGIVVLDSLTIQFNLTNPFVTFLKILATPTAYIIPHEAIEFYKKRFL